MLENLPQNIADWVWVGLVLLGLSLFFTAYYFRHQSKQLSQAISNLYNINDASKQDALDFFDKAWSVLETVGCVKLQANIEWFGERKSVLKGRNGSTNTNAHSYSVNRDDMRFEIVLYLTREAGHPDSIASLVVRTFLHILEENLVLKQAEILTSQKRLERYQLFVQHEIKNIAQFIQLLSEQVQMVNDVESKVKLIDRIGSTIPVMAKRARKTIDHMQHPLSEFYEGNVLGMQDLLSDVVEMYSLDANVKGQASTNLPRQMLLEVFKNILGNFRDHESSNKPIEIEIEQDPLNDRVYIHIQAKQLEGQAFFSERMFEPFWTTSESGMGLGLFLARELLKQLDGAIEFYQDEQLNAFGFEIAVPGVS